MLMSVQYVTTLLGGTSRELFEVIGIILQRMSGHSLPVALMNDWKEIKSPGIVLSTLVLIVALLVSPYMA